jgi:hypothetical protein
LGRIGKSPECLCEQMRLKLKVPITFRRWEVKSLSNENLR